MGLYWYATHIVTRGLGVVSTIAGHCESGLRSIMVGVRVRRRYESRSFYGLCHAIYRHNRGMSSGRHGSWAAANQVNRAYYGHAFIIVLSLLLLYGTRAVCYLPKNCMRVVY